MVRFVVLRHAPSAESARPLHWDLLVEAGEALATWALNEPPEGDGPFRAERLADHRPAYLDYEGPISGGRGVVTRWDAGQALVESADDEAWVVEFFGARLRGRRRLERSSVAPDAWVLAPAAKPEN